MQLSPRQLRDVARVAVQTAVATAAVFAFMRWQALPHESWAIISALFTIKLSSDSALGTGVGRITGALIGSAIGLGAAHLFNGPYEVLISVVAASTLANMIGTVRSGLTYASVAAAVVALSADAALGDALYRALAVMIGAAAALAASFLVWPEWGRQRALRAIADALEDCRDLADASFRSLLEGRPADRRGVAARFNGNYEKADSATGETRFLPRLRGGAPLRDYLMAVDRLWHGIILLDRAAIGRLNGYDRNDLDDLREALAANWKALSAYLDVLGIALRQRARRPPSAQEVVRSIREAERIARQRLEARKEAGAERTIPLAALCFALGELAGNVEEVSARHSTHREGRAAQPAATGKNEAFGGAAMPRRG